MAEFDPKAWREAQLTADRAAGLPQRNGRDDVTVVAYAFGAPEEMIDYGRAIELALRETYRHCGLLKTTLVVNRPTKEIEAFATSCGARFRLDVDESLKVGNIVDFSRNMIRTLPARFDTPFMLNIHPDGFPLREGLDEFVGRYDYIGGPWDPSHDDWITRRLLTRWDGAGNGGFALRSRKICEVGAAAYRRFWKMIPDCYLLYEDIFFTRFLPRWQRGYAHMVSLAPRECGRAARFRTPSVRLPLLARLRAAYANPRLNFGSAYGIFRSTFTREIASYVNRIRTNCFNRGIVQGGTAGMFFIRDSNGNEVDVVLKDGRDIDLVEIKSAVSFNEDYAKGILKYAKLIPEFRHGTVVYAGAPASVNGVDFVNFMAI